MDIQAEKAEVIKRFEEVTDISLIRAIKNLLDFGLKRVEDPQLTASIEQALRESAEKKVRAHEEVMDELRARYKK
jgi:hypothetical protein